MRFGSISTANLIVNALAVLSQLCKEMESESLSSCPMFGAMEYTQANLEDISLEHVEVPPNMERVSENLDADLMTVKISTINPTLKELVNVMDAIVQKKAQIKIIQEEFHLKNLDSGHKK